MVNYLLATSSSLGEKFFIGAIDGLIFAIIMYFVWKRREKKEKKQYVEELKKEIYHDSSSRSIVSGNIIEIDGYSSLYGELKEKCNPANYMDPYNAEKVEISNQIYSQLDNNKNNVSELIDLRNLAIKKLGLSFSAKELYDKLSEIYNPINFVGEKYDADKLHVANQVYSKVQDSADDIVELEKIAIENGIVLKGKTNLEKQPLKANQQANFFSEEKNNGYDNVLITILILIIIFVFIAIAIGTSMS